MADTAGKVYAKAFLNHKGGKQMADNLPRGRQKNVTGQGAGVHRRGSGTGAGPVGSGSYMSSSGGTGTSGGGKRSGGRPSLLTIIIILAVMMMGGGGALSGLLGGGGAQPAQPRHPGS